MQVFARSIPLWEVRDRLRASGLAAKPGQDTSPGQHFSSQTVVTVYMNPLSDRVGSCKQLQALD